MFNFAKYHPYSVKLLVSIFGFIYLANEETAFFRKFSKQKNMQNVVYRLPLLVITTAALRILPREKINVGKWLVLN